MPFSNATVHALRTWPLPKWMEMPLFSLAASSPHLQPPTHVGLGGHWLPGGFGSGTQGRVPRSHSPGSWDIPDGAMPLCPQGVPSLGHRCPSLAIPQASMGTEASPIPSTMGTAPAGTRFPPEHHERSLQHRVSQGGRIPTRLGMGTLEKAAWAVALLHASHGPHRRAPGSSRGCQQPRRCLPAGPGAADVPSAPAAA